MADARMIHINEEYIVRIIGDAETDYTDEELKEVLATYPEVLAAKIKDHFAEGDDYTVKVEPVKRGKWLPQHYEGGILNGQNVDKCTLCGFERLIDDIEFKTMHRYCPNCGARMEG